MEEVITWLFDHYGQPIYLCVNNGVVHMNLSIGIEDVEIMQDSVTVYHGDDSIRVKPAGALIYENEGLHIKHPTVEIAFLTGEEV